MQIDGAVIEEQGVTFSILCVKSYVLQNRFKADKFRSSIQHLFPAPIILMAQDSHGIPTYQGRKDIVDFLVNLDISQIPWKTYTIN